MTAALIVVGLLAAFFLGTTIYVGQAMLKQGREYGHEMVKLADGLRSTIDEHWELRIAGINARHLAEIERLQNMKTVGQPTLPAATVLRETIEPEARLERAVSEEAIATGTKAIMEEYQNIGVPITEVEARAQAELALSQGGFS